MGDIYVEVIMKKFVSRKSEYVAAIRMTNTAMKKELRKNASDQDVPFISECVESISYYYKRLDELEEERAAAADKRLGSGAAMWKRAVIISLAVILTLAAGAAVAEVSGARVWTAIVKQDSGYLQVNYVPSEDDYPTAPPIEWHEGEIAYFTYAEFASNMLQNGVKPLPSEWNGFVFADGRINSTPTTYHAMVTLRCGGNFIRISMVESPDADSTISVGGLVANIETSRLVIGGCDVIFQQTDNLFFATWQYEGSVFIVSADCSLENFALLLDTLIS